MFSTLELWHLKSIWEIQIKNRHRVGPACHPAHSVVGDACSLLSFHRTVISLCSYEIYGYVNNDYLVVENDDNKIY
jgi:hypothetical protein